MNRVCSLLLIAQHVHYWQTTLAVTPISVSSILVVRLGGAGASSGVTQSVFFDEYAPGVANASLVQSIPLSTSVCTLAAGLAANNWWDTEGLPTLSGNGQVVTLPCYRAPTGTLAQAGSSTPYTLASLSSTGALDTTTWVANTFLFEPASPGALLAVHNVATMNGTLYYLGAAPGFSCASCDGGFFTALPQGAGQGANMVAGSTVGSPGYGDPRCLQFSNAAGRAEQLYGSAGAADAPQNGVFALGPALSSLTSDLQSVMLAGTAPSGASPWTFVLENATSVWVADDAHLASFNVRHFTLGAAAGSKWGSSGSFSWSTTSAVRSLCGRAETSPAASFVLYGTSDAALYRYTVATRTAAVLAPAPAGSLFRGVSLAPNKATLTPTPTVTASHNFSPTRTSPATRTSTPSRQFDVFLPGNILVVRLGDGTAPVNSTGVALPVFLDEYAPSGGSGAPSSSTALPPGACTLATGGWAATPQLPPQWYDTEGLPSVSSNGQLVVLPCYAAPVGALISNPLWTDPPVMRTIALVRANGVVDVSTSLLANGGVFSMLLEDWQTAPVALGFRQVATTDGVMLYSAAAPGWDLSELYAAGLIATPFGNDPNASAGDQSATISGPFDANTWEYTPPGTNDIRAVAFYAGTLYATDSVNDEGFGGLFSVSGVPACVNGFTSCAAVMLPSFPGSLSPWTFVFSSATSVWLAEDSAPTLYNTLQFTAAAVGGAWSQAPTSVLFEAGTPIYSLTGRAEAGGEFALYAASPTTLYRYATVAGTLSTVASARPGTVFRGVALPPANAGWVHDTASPSRSTAPSLSRTRSPPATPTPSGSLGATPSPTPAPTRSATVTGTPTVSGAATPTGSATPRVNRWRGAAASVLVVRVGSPAAPALSSMNGTALPVFIDEYSATPGAPVSAALPLPCSLSVGRLPAYPPFIWHDTSGFPTLSGDGTVVTLPCWAVAHGSPILDDPSVLKTVVVLGADGTADASTSSIYPYSTYSYWEPYATSFIALHAAATVGGTAPVYVGWGGGYAGPQAGFFLLPYGAASTSGDVISAPMYAGFPGGGDARCVGVYGGQLYGTDSVADAGWNAVFALGVGLPSAPVVIEGGTHVLVTIGSPWTFVFENATSLWVADDSSLATGNIRHAVAAPPVSGGVATWAVAGSAVLNKTAPIYSIAGARSGSGSSFVLYACTSTKLYTYDTGTRVITTLAAAAVGTVFRGVVMPPQHPEWISPSVTVSASGTKSPSGTPPVTQSAVVTPTTSGSSTASGMGSGSGTWTPTASASGTLTPSAAATNTGSGTRTATQSVSAATSFTCTPSAAAPFSATGTGTGTGTPSAAASFSATGTGTPSRSLSTTSTASISSTSTATRTGLAIPSGQPTVTPLATVSSSPTATQTLTPSMSGTRTAPPSVSAAETAVAATPSGAASPTVTATPSSTPSSSSVASVTTSGNRSVASSNMTTLASASPASSGSSTTSGTASTAASGTAFGTAAALSPTSTMTSTLTPSGSSTTPISFSASTTPPPSMSTSPSPASTLTPLILPPSASPSPSGALTPPALSATATATALIDGGSSSSSSATATGSVGGWGAPTASPGSTAPTPTASRTGTASVSASASSSSTCTLSVCALPPLNNTGGANANSSDVSAVAAAATTALPAPVIAGTVVGVAVVGGAAVALVLAGLRLRPRRAKKLLASYPPPTAASSATATVVVTMNQQSARPHPLLVDYGDPDVAAQAASVRGGADAAAASTVMFVNPYRTRFEPQRVGRGRNERGRGTA